MTDAWQASAREVAGSTWPVAVIGCGPAGAFAALHLGRRGVPVVVLEKHRFPRDKVCGDALMPDAVAALARAGLLDEVRARSYAAERLCMYSPSRIAVPIEAKTLVLPRIELDALLAEAAARSGAVVAEASIRAIESTGDEVRLRMSDGAAIRARIAILATGADVRLLRDIATVHEPKPSAVAVRRYIRSSAVVDRLIISFDRSIVPGYAWIFPLPNGAYNVGCGTLYGRSENLAKMLDRFLEDFPLARDVVRGASSIGPLQGAVLRTGLVPPAKIRVPNVVAIGESIGTTFPLSGEGIGKAMETGERIAELVARALERNDLSILKEFDRTIASLRPLFDAYRVGEAWIARPWLNDAVARLARRSAYARRAFAEILDETRDPRAIFSMRGVVRMLVG